MSSFKLRMIALIMILNILPASSGDSRLPISRDVSWLVRQLKTRRISVGSPSLGTYPKANAGAGYSTDNDARFGVALYGGRGSNPIVLLFGARKERRQGYRYHSACLLVDKKYEDGDVWFFCNDELLKKHIDLSMADRARRERDHPQSTTWPGSDEFVGMNIGLWALLEQLRITAIRSGTTLDHLAPKPALEVSYPTDDGTVFGVRTYISDNGRLVLQLFGTTDSEQRGFRLHSACLVARGFLVLHRHDTWYFCDHELLKKHIKLSMAKHGFTSSADAENELQQVTAEGETKDRAGDVSSPRAEGTAKAQTDDSDKE